MMKYNQKKFHKIYNVSVQSSLTWSHAKFSDKSLLIIKRAVPNMYLIWTSKKDPNRFIRDLRNFFRVKQSGSLFNLNRDFFFILSTAIYEQSKTDALDAAMLNSWWAEQIF